MIIVELYGIRLWIKYDYIHNIGDNLTPSSDDITIYKVEICDTNKDISVLLDSYIRTEDIYDDIKCQILIHEADESNREDREKD
jgi:hypothetical protein